MTARDPARRLMRMLAAVCVVAVLLAPGRARCDAPEFDFQAPASPVDPAAPAAMRDLAVRLLPVYQDADPDRYLANLSALQMAAGDYSSADVSRQSLRDRRRRADQHRPVGRSVIFDIYAYAKAIEAENRVAFNEGFGRAYREVVRRLDDHDEYVVNAWFGLPASGFRESLQKLLDQQRPKGGIGEADALQLIWAYVSFDAYRQFGPLVTALDAEEDQRRYVADTVAPIKRRAGGSIAIVVIRPRTVGKPGPALLEFTLGESAGRARESAARGYVGVEAHVVGPTGGAATSVPYQTESEDTRAVIEWITKQTWSDGRVGMTGDGYGGFAAWAAARAAPAALKAIATSAPTAPGVDFPMAGNIFANAGFRWSLAATAAGVPAAGVPAASPPVPATTVKDEAEWRALDQRWYASGRRYRDLGRLFGTPNPLFLRWLNHPSYDRYWQRMIPFQAQFGAIKIPVLTTTGYYAASEPGALYYFGEHLRHNPRADHALVIGPYDDAGLVRGLSPTAAGAVAEAAANLDLSELRYQWLDHVFKGGPMPSVVKDRVNYELPGANEWRHAPSLESLEKNSRRFYLDPQEAGIGRTLSTHKPARVLSTHQMVSLADRSDVARVWSADIVAKSPDLHNAVAFVSQPLTEPLDVAGLFSARLDLAVNKMDVDLEVALYEQTAAGEFVRLFGPAQAFRASYVRDRVHRHLLRAGAREQLPLRGERFAARRLQAGGRLVVVLGIVKRPDREINYGTGNDVSEESLADGANPLKVDWYNDSYIDLPVGR